MYITDYKNRGGKNSLFKCLVKKQTKTPVTLREFADRRNDVLVYRRLGGFGDIMMHRMLFEKLATSGMRITFACPTQFHPLVADHPFLYAVVDCKTVDKTKYAVVYDTTTRCRVHENRLAPFCYDHRSDIWAATCGVRLDRHDMHVRPNALVPQIKQVIGTGPTVLFVHASTGIAEKNLAPALVERVVAGIRQRGMTVVGLHHEREPMLEKLGAVQITTHCLHTWMATIAAVDYVITIDTAAFHYAGGLGKKMVGVFSFTDGKVYGKYFNFVLVQRHRDNGDWDCGPCFNYEECPKAKIDGRFPCIATLKAEDILEGLDRLRGGGSRITLEVLAEPPARE